METPYQTGSGGYERIEMSFSHHDKSDSCTTLLSFHVVKKSIAMSFTSQKEEEEGEGDEGNKESILSSHHLL